MTKPFDCQGFYVIDNTGTILSASSCALVPADAIADIDTDELSDSEISDLRLYGRNVLADAQALDSIAAHLSGRAWSPDDLAFVYQVLLSTGRVVEDVIEQEPHNTIDAAQLRSDHGTWVEDPNFPVSDWQAEVENDETRLGYFEWLEARLDQRAEESTCATDSQ